METLSLIAIAAAAAFTIGAEVAKEPRLRILAAASAIAAAGLWFVHDGGTDAAPEHDAAVSTGKDMAQVPPAAPTKGTDIAKSPDKPGESQGVTGTGGPAAGRKRIYDRLGENGEIPAR